MQYWELGRLEGAIARAADDAVEEAHLSEEGLLALRDALDRRRGAQERLADVLAERGERAVAEVDLLGAELLFASALVRHPYERGNELYAEPEDDDSRERLRRGLARIRDGLYRSRTDSPLRQLGVLEDARLGRASAFGFAGDGRVLTATWNRQTEGESRGELLLTDLESRRTVVLDADAGRIGRRLAVQGSLAAASSGGGLKLWHLEEGRRIAEQAHQGVVELRLAAGGFLLSRMAGWRGYSLPDLERLDSVRFGPGVRALSPVPDRPWIVVGEEAKVRIIDLEDRTRATASEAKARVSAVAVSANLDWLAYADHEGRITLEKPPPDLIGNFMRGTERQEAHDRRIRGLQFSPDGEVVASVEAYRLGQELDADHRVRFWEVDSGALVQEDRVPSALSRLRFDPSGRRVAVAAAGDIVVLPVRYELLRGLTPEELLAQAERRSGTVGRVAPATESP